MSKHKFVELTPVEKINLLTPFVDEFVEMNKETLIDDYGDDYKTPLINCLEVAFNNGVNKISPNESRLLEWFIYYITTEYEKDLEEYTEDDERFKVSTVILNKIHYEFTFVSHIGDTYISEPEFNGDIYRVEKKSNEDVIKDIQDEIESIDNKIKKLDKKRIKLNDKLKKLLPKG